ncbi:DUF3231 family protein [Litchfieldia alkalitelluris]|uniref:DUF3231 family protein n=1 Tax=Litchfieldia alkalitelluris TaxID=304268 RepID=UPI000996B126|nr:DUF3231 family protein [Litchfieldia alkalitelluris]
MKTEHHIRLTSAEISSLWGSYMNNSMAVCVLGHFLEVVEDKEIESVVRMAFDIANQALEGAKRIFIEENYPVPHGFTKEEDVISQAGRLWSDEFFLQYINQTAKSGFAAYGMALGQSSRKDILEYFNGTLQSTIDLNEKVKGTLLSKGLYVRPPYINPPQKVSFVKKQGFLTGWFGERKPLLGIEIAHLFHNIETNAVGKALIMGFSQVARNQDSRDYFARGKELSKKQIEVFSSLLNEEDIPDPMTWDTDVTESMNPPFSDKLMMVHISFLNAVGVGNYGLAMSASTRRDLIAHFVRLAAEIGQYAEDGANLMIKHSWLEEPPQSADREKLTR